MNDTPPPSPHTPLETSVPARKSGHTRIVVMGALMVAIVGGLLYVKQGSKQEQAAIAEAKQVAAAQRAARDADIAQQLMTDYKGESTNATQQSLVARVGKAISEKSDAKTGKTPLRFHLLAEPNALNLFALASGDVYVTTALVNRMQTEGQLAAALAHGAAHVLVGDGMEPTTLPENSASLPLWNHSVDQERAADILAVKLMSQAGYDPNAMQGLFAILSKAYQMRADVSFFITHPNEERRLDGVAAAISALYPQGVPPELSK